MDGYLQTGDVTISDDGTEVFSSEAKLKKSKNKFTKGCSPAMFRHFIEFLKKNQEC